MLHDTLKKAKRYINKRYNNDVEVSIIQDLILAIEDLQKEKQQIIKTATNMILTGPCQKHIDEALDNYEVVYEKLEDKCLMCVLEELQKLQKSVRAENHSLQDSL